MAAGGHKNFRLRGIPLECETRSEVCSLIQKTLALKPSASPTVYSLACSPTDPNSKIATLSFPSIPGCLSDGTKVDWSFNLSDDNDIDFSRSLAFDTHFTGFTPFHRASDNDCHIDLVAVCGLGGHALGSFKEKNGRFVWLRDALPSDIPNARILTYGYDTKLSNSGAFQNLTDLGRALQIDLEGIRDPNQRRSILFIGHSLGGLVIKETVRLLEEEPLWPDFPILNDVSGFAFFGVPHRGLEVKCLVPLVKDNPNRALLESLNKNSSLLDHLQNGFGKIAKARGLPVVSFYETEKSPTAVWINGKWDMSGPSEVLVEVFSATCGCQKQHPINRNHSEMVKYSGVHDQLYRRVVIALRPILGVSRGRPGIGGTIEGPQGLKPDFDKCLKSLSFPEQEHRYSELSYASDTCDWLLEDHNYQKWINTARGLFWIKGYPGTGKSVLMKFAVDTMSRRKSGEIIASFFIHGRGISLQRTPLGIFRALLNSLLLSFPNYLSELTEVFQDKQKRYGSYEQKNGWQWNERELQKFLSRLLIEGTKEIPVVIFIDALDECGDHAKSLLVSLKSLAEKAEQEGSLVRICFSSRHFPILGHETMARVYVEERNDEDIRLVIEGRLKDLHPVEKRRQIEKEVILKAHGGFQWAILITNMILDEDAAGARTKDLLKVISTTPPDLDDLYGIILKGATMDKFEQMTKLFRWVAYAMRPLSAQELREALATDKDMTFKTTSELRSQGNWSDDVSQFEKRVRYISRGLVEFQDRDVYEQYEPGGEEWNREAQFIHQSAADFVIEKFLSNPIGGQTSVSPAGAGHFEISRSFLRYLALTDILNEDKMCRKQLSVAFPLLPYGVAYLLTHILSVEDQGIPQTDLVELIQWGRPERLELLARRWGIMDPAGTHAPMGWPYLHASVLHLAIAFRSATLLDTLLSKGSSDLDARDLEGNTPLHLALREGYEELAFMILDRSRTWHAECDSVHLTDKPNEHKVPSRYISHVNAITDDGDTPLGLAVSIGSNRIIRSLIDLGADVKHEKPLLLYSISKNDKGLVTLLIEKGADLEGAVYFAISCLERASDPGILKGLLDADAGTYRYNDGEVSNYDEGSYSDEEDIDQDEEAIFLASRNGNTEAVNLLLSYDYTRGFSARVRNKHGDVPLRVAIIQGHLETAKFLLRAYPEAVLLRNNEGQTALDAAMSIGQWAAVQLFISDGVGSLTLQQFFHRVVADNNLEFAKALLEADEDVIQLANQSHGEFDAPFLVVVREGYHDMAKLLLDTGKIDPSVKDARGNTPLHWAARNGDVALANLLLETGKVDLSQKAVDGRTPLSRAFQNAHRDMVMFLLLRPEFDIDQSEPTGDTPFWWSVKYQDFEIMRLLIGLGADVNQKNEEGKNPLEYALEKQSHEVVKFLLDTDCILDLHICNGYGPTPFLWALQFNDYEIVRMLLQSDQFDVNRDETLDWTAFYWAVTMRRDGLVSVLHDSGKLDVNAKNPHGQTPLISCVDDGNESGVEKLLRTGKVDLNVVDDMGNTAVSLAQHKGYEAIVTMLYDYMQETGVTLTLPTRWLDLSTRS
ncbi:hypothetical protein FOMG_18558 [Fusarium oxysporum f. sp. melonis 26406]|uniref:Nephrocystin 3-like N-terminal domain-containing protein n=1 Tax=Fusarium oxysporum f. sp. melonis 26406 TaxID=1089452 RepID=W9ZUF4_FUSOX|nr:hypothetical protein FOMG_18558 [Fusarium oxysporum f. sp. melonis 26406]